MNPFSTRAIRWIAGLMAVSFLTGVVFMLFGPELEVEQTAGPSSFSVSAIGNKGLVELLREVDIPVLVSRRESVHRAGKDGLLVLAAPEGFNEELDTLLKTLRNRLDGATLLVLPKYEWTTASSDSSYVASVELMSASAVEEVLEAAGIEGQVIRTAGGSHWQSNTFDAGPTLGTVQLVASSAMSPLLETTAGVLIGEVDHRGGHHMVVLSDPDLLANFAIFRGDNAILAMDLIEHSRPGPGPVVVDETIHGFYFEPSLWSELVRFPLVLATSTGLATIALLLWATMRRFGAPRREPPPHAPGKDYLISNTAELLWYGRHSGLSLKRYLDQTIRAVSTGLKAPPTTSDAARAVWLDRIAEQRGAVNRLRRLEHDVSTVSGATEARHRRVLQIAQRIHRWRQEMLDESGAS